MRNFAKLASSVLALIAVSLPAQAFAADIILGASGPITGANAAFGDQLKHGVEMAVDDLNAQGGLLGNRVVLSLGDDQVTPSSASPWPISSRREA